MKGGVLRSLPIYALLMGLLALGIFIAYVVRSKPQPVAAPGATADASGDERQALLQSIAHLDDLYAAGELGEDNYNALRTAEKRRLVQLSEPVAATAEVNTDLEQLDA